MEGVRQAKFHLPEVGYIEVSFADSTTATCICVLLNAAVPVADSFNAELARLLNETDAEQLAGKTPVAIVVLHDGTELHFFQFVDTSDADHPQPGLVPRYLLANC